MKKQLSNILIAIVFCGLLVGMGFTQTLLKSLPQLIMIFFGMLALGSLIIKRSFISSIPFYIVLGVMFYINIFLLASAAVDFIHPHQDWTTQNDGSIDRSPNLNWLGAIIVSFFLSPLSIVFYHKKIQRNKGLEIAFITLFIIVTLIIYIKFELLCCN